MTWIRDQWPLLAVAAYFLLFMGGVVGLQIWRIKRRHERPPVAFKLLRGPGETLRRRVAKFEDDFLFRVGGAAFVPLTAALVVSSAIVVFRPHTSLRTGLGIVALAFIAALIPSIRWALRNFAQARNDRLGYLGEREVAEHLQPLLANGYRVFHDVPAEGSKAAFNLDHVAVGPTGVALIETKTRRKGKARPGFKDHEVAFDGQQLIWPWGKDRDAIDQAISEANWLEQWLFGRTGLKVTVKPILTMPGWYVRESPCQLLRVVNAKILPDVIRGRGETKLTPDQIDLIARQLDDRCRDVTD